ncbi:hypothetical protein Enr8_39360 [Blastopirellula retiformator]|uniref:Uncharacterized protein n=1 Tax=Blastopirellula retiformator TaxID=2527970 RepID=A0A5C5V215_9BACT|nr:hypothetical protein Enr8_39360 [Blastopirellula retiformator]
MNCDILANFPDPGMVYTSKLILSAITAVRLGECLRI